jgi:hypothetical protein
VLKWRCDGHSGCIGTGIFWRTSNYWGENLYLAISLTDLANKILDRCCNFVNFLKWLPELSQDSRMRLCYSSKYYFGTGQNFCRFNVQQAPMFAASFTSVLVSLCLTLHSSWSVSGYNLYDNTHENAVSACNKEPTKKVKNGMDICEWSQILSAWKILHFWICVDKDDVKNLTLACSVRVQRLIKLLMLMWRIFRTQWHSRFALNFLSLNAI